MRTLLALALAVSLLFEAPRALAGPNGNITIYNMPIALDGSVQPPVIPSCGARPTPLFNGFFAKMAFAVFAELTGATAAGISGAEFYLTGLEASTELTGGWTASTSFPAGTTVAGNIHEPSLQDMAVVRRGNVSWSVMDPNDPDCQTATRVQLAVIVLQSRLGSPDFPGFDHRVTVVGGNPPSDPLLSCPVLRLCDAPVFTGVCVTGDDFTLNPTYGGTGRAAEVGEPYPPDGATSVSRNVDLSWHWFPGDDCTPTAWMPEVYFGTDPEALVLSYDPLACGGRYCYSPGLLAANTTYYWRAAGGYASSPLWRFTTGDAIAVQPSTWGRVKQLYR